MADAQQTAPIPARSRPVDYWYTEAWYGGRKVFIEFVKHFVFFWMLVGSILLFSYVLSKSSLPASQHDLLDKIAFWMDLAALVIFFGSFIIKVVYLEAKGER